jgi:hypothetical protein
LRGADRERVELVLPTAALPRCSSSSFEGT